MKVIDQEIASLKNSISEMWALVHQQLYNAGEAMLTGDKELAYKVISRERRVNAFELKIDSDCEDIIALYAPVAVDLRFVLAMYKINTNLERLGDFAESIARFAGNLPEGARRSATDQRDTGGRNAERTAQHAQSQPGSLRKRKFGNSLPHFPQRQPDRRDQP